MRRDSETPLSDLSREELKQLVDGLDFIRRQALADIDDLIGRWDRIPESERLADVRRASAVLLVNPWPLTASVMAGLREFDSAP